MALKSKTSKVERVVLYELHLNNKKDVMLITFPVGKSIPGGQRVRPYPLGYRVQVGDDWLVWTDSEVRAGDEKF